ncbi:hypothetical protein KSS87_009819 [Heliosperma pusillum]|nr:hypothetical protein KSS87_009819 [Heliosperma pusillum]
MLNKLFDGARKFYSLPLEDKIKLNRKGNRGYTALYAEKLNPSPTAKGDAKESFYIGPLDFEAGKLNQWPSEELLPNWRSNMEIYHRTALAARSLLSLVALALDQDEVFLNDNGFMDSPIGFLRLVRYPGDLARSNDEDILGASAHSDYGMMALLATDGVPGLQARSKLSLLLLPHVHNMFAGKEIVNHVYGRMFLILRATHHPELPSTTMYQLQLFSSLTSLPPPNHHHHRSEMTSATHLHAPPIIPQEVATPNSVVPFLHQRSPSRTT